MKEFFKAMWNSVEFILGWLTLFFVSLTLDLIGAIVAGDGQDVLITSIFLVIATLLLWLYIHQYNQSIVRGKIIKEELGIVGEVKVTLK